MLFRKDILNIDKIIKKNFDVVEFEKTDVRLSENEFGYQSNHYLIKLKKKWCSIPSYKNFTGIVAELQVRTMAQHIWASISHKVQYKNEVSIPSPMRRTIHRVSALLETVDLEFDRVLKERNAYLKGINTEQDQEINVDLLIRIGDDYFPKEDEECAGFESLLQDLNHFQIKTLSVLKSLLDKHLDGIMDADQNQAKIALTDETYTNFHEKAVKGRFYSHVGLFRQALRLEYGDEAVNDLFKFRSSKFLAEDENELPI